MTPKLTGRRRQGRREHGDWRVPLDNPADAEHLPRLPLGMWQRLHAQAASWQEAQGDFDIIPLTGAPRRMRLALAWLLLLPLSLVMVLALVLQLFRATPVVGRADFWLSDPVWFTLVGIGGLAALLIIKLANPLLIYIYVLGHELTHAVAALMCFGKIKDFRVGCRGGYVVTDTDNLFISLSPYFVPFWMLVWMLLLWAGNALWPFAEYETWFYAGFGFWWSYHLVWTFWVIPREQPDLLENGLFFSMLVVLLSNIAVLIGVLCFFNIISFDGYFAEMKNSALLLRDTGMDMLGLLRSLLGL